MFFVTIKKHLQFSEFNPYTYHAPRCLIFQTIISDRSSIGKILKHITGTVRKDIGIRKLSL